MIDTKAKWNKLFSREGVDVATIVEVDKAFYELIREFSTKENEVFFTELKDKKFTHYTTLNFISVGKPCYEKYMNSKEKIIKLYERGRILLEENQKVVKNIAARLSDKPSTSDLIEALTEFNTRYEEVIFWYSIMPFWVIEYWQQAFHEMLIKLAGRSGLESQIDLFSASILRPWKKTSLVELQEKIKAGESAEKLSEEYQFLRSWAFVWYKPITLDWINSLGKTKRREMEAKLFGMKEIMEKLKPDAKEKNLILISPYLTFFKDFRDDLRRKHAFMWSFLFEKIAADLGVSIEELGYLDLAEIKTALSGRFCDYKKRIIWRMNHAIFISFPDNADNVTIVEREKAKFYEEIVRNLEANEKAGEIKGLVTFKGKAVGTVQVIKDFSDVNNFVSGSVLVANTTHPNYLPAMKKASAFITDEGGVTSHAAIVAREFGIPCIVGAKIATKVLKDGMRVEVDAERGVVAIIKRKI